MKRHFLHGLSLAALVLTLMFVMVLANSSALAGHGDSTLNSSNFEIDTDANITVDHPAPSLDWANVTEIRKDDQPSGQNDDSFGQGAKEDTEVPSVVSGSIPPNKSDLKTFGVLQEQNELGNFLHLFWTRVQDPAGTTNMDFEFNQSTTISGNGITPVRTSGDLLIVYELSKGGTVPSIFILEWLDGTEPGAACDSSNSFPCWGNRQALGAGQATGSINTSAIAAADSDGLGDLTPRTFGEASINLDVIFDANACESFGSAYLKSRSSDSFTAALKDFIAPEPVDITNCGKVTIRKQTDPDGAAGIFGYTTVLNTEAATNPSFSLSDDGVQTYLDVLFDTGYSVTEDSLAPGFTLIDIDCNVAAHPSVGVTPSIDLATGTVTFDIDDDGDVLDCTFTNQAGGSITIVKDAVPDDEQDFAYTGSGPDAFNFEGGFSLDDDADATLPNTITFSDLPPGAYSVNEGNVAGWDLEFLECSDEEDPAGASTTDVPSQTASISLQAGEDVSCTFTNVKRAAMIVKKLTNPAGAPGTFTFTGDAAGSIGHDGTIIVPDLIAGMYTSTEADPTGQGFILESIVCDDANSVGDVPSRTATFNLEPGEIVTCTFTNATGAIEVTKTRKHAADGPGDHPHAGVDFTVDGVTKATLADGTVCFDGLLPGTSYNVDETVPTGYSASPSASQSVLVSAGATCDLGTPDGVSFHNTPLTDISWSVDSQVDGGTLTEVDCRDGNGQSLAGYPVTVGDGNNSVLNLLPTAPATTVTCTFTVDP